MDRLHTSMRAMVQNPPPSRIDLDGLIARERRARVRRRAGWAALAAAGTAGVVLLVAGGLALRHSPAPAGSVPIGAPPSPSLCPAVIRSSPAVEQSDQLTPPGATEPAPTEPPANAVPRLSAALTTALTTALPGRTFTDHLHANCAWLQVEPLDPPSFGYVSIIDVAEGGVLYVLVSNEELPSIELFPHHETLADGTVVGWADEWWQTDLGPDQHYQGSDREAAARRPDGTIVHASLDGTSATADELLALVTDPTLTLYP